MFWQNPFFQIYIHNFCRDDIDRALHDHPFASISLVLKGGYYDIHPGKDGQETYKLFKPGSIIFRKATDRHRVVLRRRSPQCITFVRGGVPIPAWTIFIGGPRTREWGFWCPKGFVPWYDFVDPADGSKPGKGCDG